LCGCLPPEQVNRMNSLSRAASLRYLIAIVLMLLSLQNVGALPADEVDPAAALPGHLDLKGFNAVRSNHYTSKDSAINSWSLSAVRTRDSLRFRLQVTIAATEDKARQFVQNIIWSNGVYIPPLSYTGRRFGDEIWLLAACSAWQTKALAGGCLPRGAHRYHPSLLLQLNQPILKSPMMSRCKRPWCRLRAG
jgi:hypothetical protein